MTCLLLADIGATDTQAAVSSTTGVQIPGLALIGAEAVMLTGSSYRQESTGGSWTVQMERGLYGTTPTAALASAAVLPASPVLTVAATAATAIQIASTVVPIAVPAAATGPDVAACLNSVIASLIAAGIMADA